MNKHASSYGSMFSLFFLLISLLLPCTVFAAFTPSTGQTATLVLGQADFISNGAATSQTGMTRPYGVAVDPTTGNVFVSEQDNNRVLRFASVDALSNGAAAEGVLGQADFTNGLANRGGAVAADTMYEPFALSVDSNGTLWVVDDMNNRVLRFDDAANKANGANADGVLGQVNFTSGLANGGGAVAANVMNEPFGVFVDSNGTLWVADLVNNRVLRFDDAANKANGANADGVLGQVNFTSGLANGGGAVAANVMNEPFGVFVDSNGTLWVADLVNNRVLRFDDAANKANGANADGVLGQVNFTSNVSATTQNGMYNPISVWIDSSGNLWVGDFTNNRVLRFDDAANKANGANADGVLGQVNFTSSGNACNQSSMYYPRGVNIDSAGRLYVADSENHRVLVFNNAAGLANGANANWVLGQSDFTTCTANTGGIAATTLNKPASIFFDQQYSILWIADWLNNRVLMYGNPSNDDRSIPTMTEWGMTIFIVLAGLGAVFYFRKNKRAQS